MQKILEGKIISLKMANTAVVEVERKIVHPLYKKQMRRSKKYKVDTDGISIEIGQKVRIGSIKKESRDKYFKILKVLK